MQHIKWFDYTYQEEQNWVDASRYKQTVEELQQIRSPV